jgi:ankyrin repeat protein
MKRIAATAALFLSLPLLSFAAVSPEVADAAMRQDISTVRQLIARHADVNIPQSDGATALHWAVFHSDREMTDLLLQAGANPKVANREGSTPLWLACINGDAAAIGALLKAGADPNERLPFGRTPLMAAARTGKEDAVKVLLDHGADPNAKETLRGTTALMWAADEGHAGAIPAKPSPPKVLLWRPEKLSTCAISAPCAATITASRVRLRRPAAVAEHKRALAAAARVPAAAVVAAPTTSVSISTMMPPSRPLASAIASPRRMAASSRRWSTQSAPMISTPSKCCWPPAPISTKSPATVGVPCWLPRRIAITVLANI